MRLALCFCSLALMLTTEGCQRLMSSSAPAGSEAPVPTAVGPIPGNPASVQARLNPYANDPVALQDGRRLFNWYNCSGCYGNRDDQIFDTIAQGRSNGMPCWGTKIPESQIWQIVVYVKSLGTPREPDPPIVPADEVVGLDFKSPVKMDAPSPE